MKHILIILSLFILTSCSPDSAENYKGAIVIGFPYYNYNNFTGGYRMQIRVKEGDKYSIKTIQIPEYEYNKYHIGDTIK